MQILVDADACPVVGIVERIAVSGFGCKSTER